MKFFVQYSCGIGMEDATTIKAASLDEANIRAYELAKELYKSYEGLHGILTEKECQKLGLDYISEMESCLNYNAELYNPEKHKAYL